MVIGLMISDSWPVTGCAVAGLLILFAELLHKRRQSKVARLAFGPSGKPAVWVRAVPYLRAASAAALIWGLLTLMILIPKTHTKNGSYSITSEPDKHVLLVLDVSPSMRLVDAGPSGDLSRMERAHDVLDSFLKRIPLEQYRISVVAVYNGAKAVVKDTKDLEVVRNILGDLPMHFAFPKGKTKLFDGLEAAAVMARPWNPKSTTLVLVSDGDTVSKQGMPRMPASIANVLVVGVGDPLTGKFIDGAQSRQDVSTLRQIAVRLGGTFHNGNDKHLRSTLLSELTASTGKSALQKLSRREYALIAIATGGGLLSLLPLLLAMFGTRWRPGVRVSRARASETPSNSSTSALQA